jgi:hypothetical protein
MFYQSYLRAWVPFILCGSMCSAAFSDGRDFVSFTEQEPTLLNARLPDDIPVGGEPGSLVTMVPGGSSQFVVLHDFDDLHEFNVFFDSVSFANLPNSGAIDIANVIWLGDSANGVQEQSTLVPWRAADALRTRDCNTLAYPEALFRQLFRILKSASILLLN